MFERFFDFVKEEKEVVFNSSEEFLKAMGGRTFLNGMYLSVFGYDWFGRVFALNKLRNTVLLFEPGTGDVFDIPAD